jgi:hypothetical protein
MPRTYKNISISHDSDELIKEAKRRAKRLRMSFSAYVCSLIEADLRAHRHERHNEVMEHGHTWPEQMIAAETPPPWPAKPTKGGPLGKAKGTKTPESN